MADVLTQEEANSSSAVGNEDDPPVVEGTSGIRLKNRLGLVDCVGILVGYIIGSGIFISPTGVIFYAGSVGASLVIWVLCGVISTIGAICYAELGTMIPNSGGDYAYISDIFGPLPAFMYMWVALLIIWPASNAIVAMTFANYLLQPIFRYCDMPPDPAIRIVAALVISLLTYVNCVSVRMVAKIQDLFTITKVLALAVIIVSGGYYLGSGHTENYQNPFRNTNERVGGLFTAFYQGLFSFSGWSCLNFVIEELKEPYKNLPRAILISMPLVNVIYLLTNVAYFAVLSPDEMLASYAVAVAFGNRILGVMAWIIPVFVACSTFSSLNGGILTCSRLFFVGARQGHLPRTLALLNVESVTPVTSIIFLGIVSILMLVSSDILILINYVAFTEACFILMSITGLLVERHRHPERNRPIKVWLGFPIIFFVICSFLVIMPMFEQPLEILIACSFILSGVPLYYLVVIRENKIQVIKTIRDSIMTNLQLLTRSLPQQKVN